MASWEPPENQAAPQRPQKTSDATTAPDKGAEQGIGERAATVRGAVSRSLAEIANHMGWSIRYAAHVSARYTRVSRSMSAAAFYWPHTGRLEALGTFPSNPGLADRGAADAVSDRYLRMEERGELFTLGDATVPPGEWLVEVTRRIDTPPACIVGDRFRHAEFVEAMSKAGLSAVPFIWRGFGWKDGSEDVERFRRALFDGEVKSAPSLLLRSAMSSPDWRSPHQWWGHLHPLPANLAETMYSKLEDIASL